MDLEDKGPQVCEHGCINGLFCGNCQKVIGDTEQQILEE